MSPAERDCYALIQEIACERDKVCQAPGCSVVATCGHHIFPRNRLATAFDSRYVIGLCYWCHNGWAHKEPNLFRAWCVRRMGEDEYVRGRDLSYTIVKHRDFKAKAEELREELRKIKNLDIPW